MLKLDRMPLGLLASELLGLAGEAVSSNLWGLRCPVHCTQLDLPLLLLVFILGGLGGLGVCLLLGFRPYPLVVPLETRAPAGNLPGQRAACWPPLSSLSCLRASPASPAAARSLSSAHSDRPPGPVRPEGALLHLQGHLTSRLRLSHLPHLRVYPLRAPGLSSREQVLADSCTCRYLPQPACNPPYLPAKGREGLACWLLGQGCQGRPCKVPRQIRTRVLSNRFYAVIQTHLLFTAPTLTTLALWISEPPASRSLTLSLQKARPGCTLRRPQ